MGKGSQWRKGTDRKKYDASEYWKNLEKRKKSGEKKNATA